MKFLLMIVITAVVSSAGTFFYTTKKMKPSFYNEVISKARGYLNAVRAPASDCVSGTSENALGADGEKQPSLKEMMKQINKAQQEKKEFLKQFED